MDLAALGLEATLAATVPAGAEVARVVRVDRGAVSTIGRSGEVRLGMDPLHPLHPAPTTGDWVTYRPPSDLVEAVLPRRTALIRADSFDPSKPQVLAANLDLVGVCASLGSAWNPRRVERFLTVAWASGAAPLLILTKSDAAAADADPPHVPDGIDAVRVSAVTGEGVGDLRVRLAADRSTLVLIGPSGVGKSTLVNALADSEIMATREVRAGDSRGRHTTTTRELIPLDGGGVLIDTPGIRGLVPWDDGEGLARAFPDVEARAGECRFSDCAHAGEPGCAVAAAVEAGDLPANRLLGWQRLRAAIDDLETKVVARERTERRGRNRRR